MSRGRDSEGRGYLTDCERGRLDDGGAVASSQRGGAAKLVRLGFLADTTSEDAFRQKPHKDLLDTLSVFDDRYGRVWTEVYST